MKKFVLILIAGLTFINNSFSQVAKNKNYLSVEVDPAPFILGGYSFSLKYSPKSFSHATLMASVYSSDLPDGMMMSDNKSIGFTNLKLETSYAIFADYFIKENRRGLHFGPSIFLYNKSVGHNASAQRAEFSTLYPNIRLGYVWYPFEKTNIYLNPWINVGSELNLDNRNSILGNTYKPNSMYYIAAIHLGYNINW